MDPDRYQGCHRVCFGRGTVQFHKDCTRKISPRCAECVKRWWKSDYWRSIDRRNWKPGRHDMDQECPVCGRRVYTGEVANILDLRPADRYQGVEWSQSWDCESSALSDVWLGAITGMMDKVDNRQLLCNKLQELMDDDLTCVFCSNTLLDGQDLAVLSCGHVSHWDELHEYAGELGPEYPTCPECDKPFSLQN